MFMSTPAIVEIGNTDTNAKSVVPKSNFFILLPPANADEVCPHFTEVLHHGTLSVSVICRFLSAHSRADLSPFRYVFRVADTAVPTAIGMAKK
jgi:hypothetical protein